MKKEINKNSTARQKESLAQKLREQDKRIEEGLQQLNVLRDMGLIQRPTYRLSLTGRAPVRGDLQQQR